MINLSLYFYLFFVLFFVLASVITTVFHLPAGVTGPLKELSKFLIVMAMAAIGLNTNIVKLVKTGGKPIFTENNRHYSKYHNRHTQPHKGKADDIGDG